MKDPITDQKPRRAASKVVVKRVANAAVDQPHSATELVLRFIRSGIRGGQFVPGQRLRERQLILDCAVGRSAVREALRTLAADGTITVEHRRSAIVRQFTREDVWARHQIREVLEGLAASLAASRVEALSFQSELIALEKALADCVARDDREQYLLLNYLFHALIVRMSNNPALQEHLDRALTTQLRLQSARFMDHEAMRRSYAEHKLVIEAILAGDSKAAETAMRQHIRGTRRTFLEMPEQMFAPVIRREW